MTFLNVAEEKMIFPLQKYAEREHSCGRIFYKKHQEKSILMSAEKQRGLKPSDVLSPKLSRIFYNKGVILEQTQKLPIYEKVQKATKKSIVYHKENLETERGKFPNCTRGNFAKATKRNTNL